MMKFQTILAFAAIVSVAFAAYKPPAQLASLVQVKAVAGVCPRGYVDNYDDTCVAITDLPREYGNAACLGNAACTAFGQPQCDQQRCSCCSKCGYCSSVVTSPQCFVLEKDCFQDKNDGGGVNPCKDKCPAGCDGPEDGHKAMCQECVKCFQEHFDKEDKNKDVQVLCSVSGDPHVKSFSGFVFSDYTKTDDWQSFYAVGTEQLWVKTQPTTKYKDLVTVHSVKVVIGGESVEMLGNEDNCNVQIIPSRGFDQYFQSKQPGNKFWQLTLVSGNVVYIQGACEVGGFFSFSVTIQGTANSVVGSTGMCSKTAPPANNRGF